MRRRLDMRRSRRAGAPRALALLLPLLVAACSGPTAPLDETIFADRVAYRGSVEHSFVVVDSGLIRISLDELTRFDADGVPADPDDARGSTLGLSLGRFEEGVCTTSGSFVLGRGGFVSYGLTKGDFCIRTFDPGSLIEGEELAYTLRLKPTD